MNEDPAGETPEQSAPQRPVKYFDDQFDGEEVLFVFRKHPVVMRKGLIYSSLALLVGPLITIGLTFFRPLTPPSMTFFFLSIVASLLLSALVFVPTWMSWHFSIFIVTDQRLIQITQKGFFHRSVVDMGLNQIRMVNYEVAGLQETLLGFGTMMIQTQVGDLIIHDIPKPARVQKQMLEVLRDQGLMSDRSEAAAYNGTVDYDAEEA